jgi:2-iminobutanoate/2-iminopropanoate deaminase
MKAIAAALMVVAATSVSAQSAGIRYFPAAPGSPFSTATRVGDVVYLSGQIGVGPDGKLPEGFEAQARQTMENVGAGLKRVGLGWGDVFKCTVMIDNMADWPKFNTIYVPYFPAGKLPSRSAFGADGLALGALLELECMAYAGKK